MDVAMTKAMWASENNKNHTVHANHGSRSLQTLTSAEGDARSAIGSRRCTIHVHNVEALQYRNDTRRGPTE